MANKIKAYKKEFSYSYVFGASPTIEMLRTRHSMAECVYIHSAYRDTDKLVDLCENFNIPFVYSDREFGIVKSKENCYVFGVFSKYDDTLAYDKPHIVLVNPSDMGNLGTIIRTMSGLGVFDLAGIEPAADIWNPKTIRASMDAVFHIRHHIYQSFDEYAGEYTAHDFFPFMLNGSVKPEDTHQCRLFSLIFGNESSGLDIRYKQIGQSVRIPYKDGVDSFNLSAAVAIGSYEFVKKNCIL